MAQPAGTILYLLYSRYVALVLLAISAKRSPRLNGLARKVTSGGGGGREVTALIRMIGSADAPSRARCTR